MAAFAISYEGLTRGNIRHIYSYKPTHFFVPTPRPFGKTTQFLPTPLIQRYPPRFYDYYPAFNMGLPRAPAFNRLSADEIQDMVDRITRPIACQRDRRRSDRRSKDKAKARRKDSKAVRFQTPTQGSDSGETEESGKPSDKPEEKENSEEVESEDKEVKDGSEDKVKSDKLPEVNNKKAEKSKKSNARSSKKNGEKLVLPPIK